MTTQLGNSLVPFGCGVAATVAAFFSFAEVGVRAASEAVDVCANADGAVRLIAPRVPCAEGERRVRLREPELEEQKEEPANTRLDDLSRRLAGLETRAKEGRLAPDRVEAPFEVVNEAGTVIFKVESGSVRFMNAAGTMVARVVMSDTGGYFEARSGTADLQAVIGAVAGGANVFVIESDKRRINLGRNDKGQYGLRVYEPGGKLVAGIGQSNAGNGVVAVSDSNGVQRAAMYDNEGGGALEILNTQGKVVASVLATKAGNGLMQLFNRDGVTMVEAGTTGVVGTVRAGPAAFHPGVGILGLPGSFISGKAP